MRFILVVFKFQKVNFHVSNKEKSERIEIRFLRYAYCQVVSLQIVVYKVCISG